MHSRRQGHQQQHRQAQPGRGREELGIAMRIDKVTRETSDELGQEQHHGTEQGVLGRRISDVGQG